MHYEKLDQRKDDDVYQMNCLMYIVDSKIMEKDGKCKLVWSPLSFKPSMYTLLFFSENVNVKLN